MGLLLLVSKGKRYNFIAFNDVACLYFALMCKHDANEDETRK